MADKHWSDRGQKSESFNKHAKGEKTPEKTSDRVPDDIKKDSLSLKGGPKPPPGVREKADRAAKADAARERALAKSREKDYNKQQEKNRPLKEKFNEKAKDDSRGR